MNLTDYIPKFMDRYDRAARLTPALLVAMPAVVLIQNIAGVSNSFPKIAISILFYCGLAYVLSRAARNAGQRIQDRIFVKWGGAPTTQLLRHQNNLIDAVTKARFHDLLGKGINRALPSREEEVANPSGADEVYTGATAWLREQTRDTKKFSLLFNENIAFGFQRNSLGLRPAGLTISLVCLLIVLVRTGAVSIGAPYVSQTAFLGMSISDVLVLSISAGMLLIWLFVLNEPALKRTGLAYATQLLFCCDHLQPMPRKVRTLRPRTVRNLKATSKASPKPRASRRPKPSPKDE